MPGRRRSVRLPRTRFVSALTAATTLLVATNEPSIALLLVRKQHASSADTHRLLSALALSARSRLRPPCTRTPRPVHQRVAGNTRTSSGQHNALLIGGASGSPLNRLALNVANRYRATGAQGRNTARPTARNLRWMPAGGNAGRTICGSTSTAWNQETSRRCSKRKAASVLVARPTTGVPVARM